MNPQPEGFFNSGLLFKTSILTITLSTAYFYQPYKKFNFFKPPAVSVAYSTVAAKPKILPPPKKAHQKTIYLTFDDGPNSGTKKVMDILEAEKVPATLFLVGEHVFDSKTQNDLFDSLRTNSLFEIANHSFSHACNNKFSWFYNRPDTVLKDFARCADSLRLKSNIVRTPGRNIWRTANISATDLAASTAAADSLKQNGFTAVGWDLEWHFDNTHKLVQSDSTMKAEIDSAFARNRTHTKDALVLLAHDRCFATASDSGQLHRMIMQLKAEGIYKFETVSAYPALKN